MCGLTTGPRSRDPAGRVPNAAPAITIAIVRELPESIVDRVRLPRRRTALVLAVAVVVVAAVALAAAMPFATAGHAPAGSSPMAAAPSGDGSSGPDKTTTGAAASGQVRTSNEFGGVQTVPTPTTTSSPYAPPGTGVEPAPTGEAAATTQPSPGASCAPSADPGCVAIPVPPAVPAVNADVNPITAHVPILEYHRVKPPEGETGYAVGLVVPPEIFDTQMQALWAAGWRTITMGQLGYDLRSGIAPAPKSFVVTFDDGYGDGYTYAYPILHRYGFVATYFVIASRIGAPGQLGVPDLQALVAAGNEIGNHSMTHRNLRPLSPEQLVTETYGSSEIIAGDVGVWPRSYSYPIGLTDARVISFVSSCPAIQTAVIQGGSKRETWSNRFELPRLRVGPWTLPEDLLTRMNWYAP
jgi:peptidoglycan/xylan/chitin deacetylase (PgdA/CDA1 family)